METDVVQSAPTAPTVRVDSNGFVPTAPLGPSKKTAALWKKQLKNLKAKDVSKKLEGLQFCAQDELFFREPDVLPLLMGILSKPRVCPD